jgi:heme-degrading monooxygenase HmoA
MYIKWIICTVPDNKKEEFSKAQEKWSKTSESDGFIAQTGGWNLKNPSEACIIAFWKDKDSLQNFMDNLHDVIFIDNQQNTTYSSIKITYFESLLNIDGSVKSLNKAIQKSNFIRIADCLVTKNKIHHFEEVQQSIWIPSMKKAKGMLGGKFSINKQNKNNYFVSTFWDSKKNHQNYIENQLPVNQELTNISSDLQIITRKFIAIEKKWNVFKISTSF